MGSGNVYVPLYTEVVRMATFLPNFVSKEDNETLGEMVSKEEL